MAEPGKFLENSWKGSTEVRVVSTFVWAKDGVSLREIGENFIFGAEDAGIGP
jgi:hypothetical protein